MTKYRLRSMYEKGLSVPVSAERSVFVEAYGEAEITAEEAVSDEVIAMCSVAPPRFALFTTEVAETPVPAAPEEPAAENAALDVAPQKDEKRRK